MLRSTPRFISRILGRPFETDYNDDDRAFLARFDAGQGDHALTVVQRWEKVNGYALESGVTDRWLRQWATDAEAA